MCVSSAALVHRVPHIAAVHLWNTSIRQAVNTGNAHEALLLFRDMTRTGTQPDNLTFPFVVKACAKLLNPFDALTVHAHVAKSPLQSDIYVQTALVDAYVKCGRIGCAHKVFDEMSVKDVAAWNAMLIGLVQIGSVYEAWSLFRQMGVAGVRPDSVTVVGLTQLASDLRLVGAVHCVGIKIGVGADVSVANTYMSAYSKCGDLRLAELVLGEIEMCSRTVVTWNSMIAGYSFNEKHPEAFSVYKSMLRNGFRPDISTVLVLLTSCILPEALQLGKAAHSYGIRAGCDLDTAVMNTLVSMYSKCDEIRSARYVFDSMSLRTCVSWTAMIGGYADIGELDEAWALFYAMRVSNEEPDLVTVLSLISGCGLAGALDIGRWLEDYADSTGLIGNVMVRNALVDMYAKCGSLADARSLFDRMLDRTVVSWTAMITGCALNGEFHQALDLFFEMVESGTSPNHITFLAALQACTHSGLLDKGWQCFNLMTDRYKITPGVDHYTCMVDLLGRRGRLRDALDLIRAMPVDPDAGVWGALLSACKIHRDAELGQVATLELLELEPRSAASYVEMANIYASAQQWDGVASIRARMRSNKVRKFPGKSSVQVDGKSYIFTVDDTSHDQSFMLYEALDGLVTQMRDETELLQPDWACPS
uniref:Pentatricopeptide repeat-containing protein n=1 Tax=Kalanchoe fedtschenkoi TaxID=63787 RepID=A0A7N0T718_KALFE